MRYIKNKHYLYLQKKQENNWATLGIFVSFFALAFTFGEGMWLLWYFLGIISSAMYVRSNSYYEDEIEDIVEDYLESDCVIRWVDNFDNLYKDYE